MKKRTFNLLVVGEDNTFKDVECTDYNLESGLVRYKETVYDIRTGLWVVDMRHIRDKKPNEKTNPWYGSPRADNLLPTKMLAYVMNSKVFMRKLAEARKLTEDKAETKNESELFSQTSLF